MSRLFLLSTWLGSDPEVSKEPQFYPCFQILISPLRHMLRALRSMVLGLFDSVFNIIYMKTCSALNREVAAEFAVHEAPHHG